ncbi:MAG: hypothetical protein LBH00_12120 [Planctomycetaceae bacterium]|jgi:hypothetical protein|nr:hypothetical protein [Planctomycetaceae bacterium]
MPDKFCYNDSDDVIAEDLQTVPVMTLFDDNRYDWRETYFIYCEPEHRPELTEFYRVLRTHAPLLSVTEGETEPDDLIRKLTIASYEDHAAVEAVYREGDDILAEARLLVHSLTKDASECNTGQLQKVSRCRARFDIHHFEQTASTAAFRVVKLPTLKFTERHPDFSGGRDTVSRQGVYYFDPDSYGNCRCGRADASQESDAENILDNGGERINPDLLVSVLEILCHISRGVVIDPASGMIL